MGRMLKIMCPNTNHVKFPVHSIQKMEIPSKLSKRIFKKWIGSILGTVTLTKKEKIA